MRALISLSAHFALTADGEVWAENAGLGYSFWSNYLGVYDEITLLARAHALAEAPPGWNRVGGPRLRLARLPDFVGAAGFARHYLAIRQAARQALAQAEAVHLRVPCFVGDTVWGLLPRGRPYAVEVVADPHDSFAPGAMRHPLRPLFRWWFPRLLRRECAAACAAAYVTAQALQRRYPPAPGAFTSSFSSIELLDDAFAERPRLEAGEMRPLRLVCVGTLAQLYKAPDVLIDAVAGCARRGLDLRLTFVGDGKHRGELEARAAALGLAGRVEFLGQLPSRVAVRQQLDRADLFVLPSRQEGLPKAMIEAMARGLPCVGSAVGGIPELLPADDLVPAGDAAALARKICEVAADPPRMARMSARNWEAARAFRADTLSARRQAFYSYVRQQTAAWLNARRPASMIVPR